MSDKPATILQLVAIDETGDSYYRMRWPGRQLAEQAPNWRVLNLDARASERFIWGEEADLLIIYQSHDLDLIPLIHRRRLAGKRTVVEYNDNFYSPPPSTPVAGAWSSPILWESYERFMHESDGVIVTGPGLEDLFRKLTRVPIHILENHIPDELADFNTLWQEPKDIVRLGLAGSLGHMSDYMALGPTLRELFRLFPELHLSVMGNETIPGILGLPMERVNFTPWGSMEEYYNFWKPIHIGIAPMLDTPYNRCRSDVKALEMAACGVLPILTRALPYRLFFEKTSAPIVSHFQEILEILPEYLQNFEKLRESTKRCYDYVRSERIGNKRLERLELYRRMLPETRSAFAWPQGLGIHELNGNQNDQTREGLALQQAQQLIGAQKRDEAAELISKELNRNPYLAGLALAELKLKGGRNDADWKKRCDAHRRLFPRDIRFPLLQVRREMHHEKIDQGWNEIIQALKDSGPVATDYFGNMVVQTYLDQLKAFPHILDIGERLVEVYPGSAALRYGLAKAQEAKGNAKQAAEHVTWLLRMHELFTQNKQSFESLDATYLKTWREGLEGQS